MRALSRLFRTPIVPANSKRVPSTRPSCCWMTPVLFRLRPFPSTIVPGGRGWINGLFSFRQFEVVRRACVWNPWRLGAVVLRQEGSKCPKSAFVVPLAATFPEIFSFLSPSQRPRSFFALQTSETSQIRCLTRSKTPVSFLMHMQVFQTEI